MKQYKAWHAAGEMHVRVMVEKPVTAQDAYGEPRTSWVNVFGTGVYIPARWINTHGKDVYAAYHEELREPATVLIRYDAAVTHLCRITLEGDELPYEIISPDNIRMAGKWLELTVQRTAKGADEQ